MMSKNLFEKALQGFENDYWEIFRQIYFIIIYSDQMKQLILKNHRLWLQIKHIK